MSSKRFEYKSCSKKSSSFSGYTKYLYYCMLLFTLKTTSAFLRSGLQIQSPLLSHCRRCNTNYNYTSKSKVKTVNILTRMTLSQKECTISSSSSEAINTEKAKLISSSTKSLGEAGGRLRAGHLVSFPTETVYGLGCHALDPVAVKRVFEAKERPLSDPLIVHVNEAQAALGLWDASSSTNRADSENIEKKVLDALTENFWPGPLTIVAKASPKVPSIIMANTGFVACRAPSHPIARALIDASAVPIAAPSANKFGHVSPTKASHVFDDLWMEDVWIVDPNLDENNIIDDNASIDTICDVGVESTVAKVEISDKGIGSITVLRHGAISSQDILRCLQNVGLNDNVEVKSKQQATGENVNHVAPGQTIRHYSPNVLSYMVSHERYSNIAGNLATILSKDELSNLESGVIIDFGGRLECLKEKALAYRDLSPNGDSSVAAANVFDTLRWSETVDGGKRVYFPELVVEKDLDDALVLAVKDRLTRAASGVVVTMLI
jgi:L-threonylcarbamoyladenylate synthase